MTRIVAALAVLVAFSSANPVFRSFVNEFQVAPDSCECIELHCNAWQPGFPLDLSGWEIQTEAGIAAVNSGTVLETESSFVVIGPHNTTGTFDLADSAGFIVLIDTYGDTVEIVRYPGDAGNGRFYDTESWTPPSGMSASMHCWTWGWPDPILFLDWYTDSSPTLGYENDDGEAQICGTVRDRNLNPVDEAEVRISGPDGYETFMSWPTFEGTFQFHVGWGTFLVTAAKDGYLPGAYPESVTVHVDEEVRGIDVILYPLGVEESPVTRRPAQAAGRTLLLDVLGRRVAEMEQAAGITGVTPGVYFLRSAEGSGRPAVRKVVVQR
jgi:hypothetical protein